MILSVSSGTKRKSLEESIITHLLIVCQAFSQVNLSLKSYIAKKISKVNIGKNFKR